MNRSIAIAAATFLVGFCYFALFISYGMNLDDEGTILYQIERTLDGQTPYIDFHIGYTPATFYLHAALMKVFGTSVIPVRWLLALVNSASLAGLAVLTARVAGWWVAPLPALIYLVSIPVHGGEFAQFNIPYPAWYTTALFVWSLYCMLRFGESGATRWLVAGAALAGLDFAFKPNLGLFNLAAASFAMLATIPFAGAGRSAIDAKYRRAAWWTLWAGTLGGVWFVFAGNAGLHEVGIFLLPITVLALGVAWRSMVAEPAPEEPELIRSAAVLLGTFLLVNLPWIVPVLALLGPLRFANDVLFIGTGFEKFYYIEHPPVWALAAAFLIAGAALTVVRRLAAARGWPTDIVGIAALVSGLVGLGVYASLSLMPEGFLAAVRSEYQARFFALTLTFNLIGLLAWAQSISIGEAARIPSMRIGVVVIGALSMYLQLYPRTDYTHWVQAAPLSLVLGAVLLAAFARAWAATLTGRRRAVALAACVAPVVVIAGLRAAPGFIAAFDLDGIVPRRAAHVELGLERAPVWINAGRAVRYRDLAALVGFLRDETAEDETVFTFPNLDVVSFLSDRHNPTRHGYFYPEWPGRDVEAEVAAQLAQAPPRLSVVLHRHPLFFMNAPLYYYTLRELMDSRYMPYTELGPYAVVVRRDDEHALPHAVAIERPTPAVASAATHIDPYRRDLVYGDVGGRTAALARVADMRLETYVGVVSRALSDRSQRVRDAAVWALKSCLDPRCARALARALKRRALSYRESVLAARIIGNSGGPDAARLLLVPALAGSDEAANSASTALYHLVSRATVARYWFVQRAPGAPSEDVQRLPRAPALRRRLLRWIGNDEVEERYRYYAVWASRSAPTDEARAALERGTDASHPGVRSMVLLELAERGGARTHFNDVAETLEEGDIFPPNAMLALADATPVFDRRLARLIENGGPDQRVRAAWLAAQIGGDRTLQALGAALGARDPQMRMAALWAFEHRDRRERIGAIRPLLGDRDFRVRAFAERALARLGAAMP